MHGVTNVTARTEYFRLYCGIRQGDSTRCLGFCLFYAWLGIRARREGPIISHLIFADDLLLFIKATTKHTQCVIKVLDDFWILSGEKVSQEKTGILVKGGRSS
jgi:hypothetical protein